MGDPISADQNAWLDRIYKTTGAAPQPVTLGFPPRGKDPLEIPGLKIDPEVMKKTLEDMKKADAKKQQDAMEALEQARKWLAGLPKSILSTMTYPSILAKIKEDFPAVHDLPKPKPLMDMVEKVLKDTGYLTDKGLLGDPNKLAMEKVIAGYIAALPKSVKAIVANGGITLVSTVSVAAPAAGTEDGAKGKKPEKFEFKNKDYTIQVSNEAWKALDPALRAKWKGLNNEATALEKLQAALTSLKKEWESAKPDGTSSKVELEARIKDLEAEFKGRWDTLRETIQATAKATTDGIKISLTEAATKVKDQGAGAELELKFEEMSVGLKAFASTPDLKTALTVTGSAEKISAKIEAMALKTGTAVTLSYEKALKEVKEQLELQVKQGKTTLAATLSREAVKLEEKVKKLNDGKTKDFEEVKALEQGLEKLQLEVKAGFTAGNFTFSGGAKVATGGEVGGKVQVDLMLENGIRFDGQGSKISFSADVSNKGYVFALRFSIGEMPDLGDVHKANAEADAKIRKLYDLVKDANIRTLDDATKIKDALSEVLKPLKKSVESMKKADKRKFALELGITLTGELPSGGSMPPPVPGFSVAVKF